MAVPDDREELDRLTVPVMDVFDVAGTPENRSLVPLTSTDVVYENHRVVLSARTLARRASGEVHASGPVPGTSLTLACRSLAAHAFRRGA